MPPDKDLEEEIEELRDRVEELEDSGDIEPVTKQDVAEDMDRRSFLKLLTLGIGGLGLSSQAAGFMSLTRFADEFVSDTSVSPLTDILDKSNDINNHDIVDGGTTIWSTSNSHIPSGQVEQSNLDADTVSNVDATGLGRQVSRDSSGSVLYTTIDSNQTTSFTTNGTKTTQVSTTERAVFEQLTGKGISGTIKFYEGSTGTGSLASSNGLTANSTFSTSLNNNYASPTFIAKFSHTATASATGTFTAKRNSFQQVDN